jgi:hypothetical protein
MTLLRIIFGFIVFVFLAIFGFLTVLFKLFSSLFSSKVKSFPPASPGKSANGGTPPSSSKKSANNEVIEVEVISVRKEEDLK